MINRRTPVLTFLSIAVVLIPSVCVQAADVSFTNDVMAVLSRAGCNMGACHGNANGKGGFKLSLRGQDPTSDFYWLTRESATRRINRLKVDDSLLLLKPIGALAHQGGVRFQADSHEYRILRDWIASGAPLPKNDDDRQLERIEVTPTAAVMIEPEDCCKIGVVAYFSDGARRDVTNLAKFELSNAKAEILADGVVGRQDFGETTVIVRYLTEQVAVPVAFVPSRPNFAWSDSAPNNYVDELLFAKLRTLRTNPSELTDDHVFVRRAFLDAIGVLPTAREARDFVADTSLDKRRRLIDQLLMRPEFADHWALKWSDVLRNEEKVLDAKGVVVFHDWIRNSIADGMPIDRFVRALLRGEGSTYENPAANFWRANRNPSIRGETTARLFLGARLQCAKCHNHPFDRWTQDDYYSWAAIFARIDYEVIDNKRRDRLDKNEFVGEQVVFIKNGGRVRDPRTGETVEPKLLGDRRLGPGSHHDRLTPLAVWLTSPENRLFARTQVNFIWYHLMGRGLVEPIDDFRSTNPASIPELLDAMANDFVDHGFSLRHIVRVIMNSRAYQLSAEPNETNSEENTNFARAVVYRLPAEKLLDAQSQVIGTPARFAGYKRGLRAAQIPGVRKVRRRDGDLKSGDRFLKTFGKPERLLACECERSNETTLAQAFVLIGGELNERLASADNRLAALLQNADSDEQIVGELYWAALTRPPTSEEMDLALRLLSGGNRKLSSPENLAWSQLFESLGARQSSDDRFARLQDLTWALLNSKEFVFRH